MIILKFLIGISDSFQIFRGINRYMFPNEQLTALQMIKLMQYKTIRNTCEYSKQISEHIYGCMTCSISFTVKVLLLRLVTHIFYLLEWDNIIIEILYWIIVVLLYSVNAATMWIKTSEISTNAIKMELEYYQNRSFAEYQIEEDYLPQAIDNSIIRVMFGILFQIQTNIVGFIIIELSKKFALPLQLLKIPLYALFISTQNVSIKIPYKPHISYYLNQHKSYLIGSSLLISAYLHISSFPYFSGMLWFFAPLFQLNSIPREPPRIEGNVTMIEYILLCTKVVLGQTLDDDGQFRIIRNSYIYHLKNYGENEIYHKQSDQEVSYFSLPRLVSPVGYWLLDKTIARYQDH